MSSTPAPEYLVISTSLRSGSLSRVMAEAVREDYDKLGLPNQFVDLREFVLPLCDGETAYGHPHVETLTALIKSARVIIIATPIYNYAVNAAVKNLIELTGGAWENKTVGFLCAAGGGSSYMSVMGLANSMMLDFRCLIIPRFVYAQGDDFAGQKPNPALAERLTALVDVSTKIRNAA
jgi:FMN reductase